MDKILTVRSKNEILSSVLYIKSRISTLVMMFLLKVALEIGYIFSLSPKEPQVYPVMFSISRYINGMLWLFILICLIKSNEKRVSAFMLELFFIMQVLPITIIYEMQIGDFFYYNVICLSLAICELIILSIKEFTIPIAFSENVRHWIIEGLLCVFVLFMIYVYCKNGIPTLRALDFEDAYRYRASGQYKLGKIAKYVQDVIIVVIAPILLAYYCIYKKWIKVLFVVALESVLYLYVAQKGIFFSAVVVVFIVLWMKKESISQYFFAFLSACLSFFSLVARLGLTPYSKPIFSRLYWIYSIVVRRVLFLSAKNKYVYYDFFSKNPKEGFAGIFPRWLVDVPSNYEAGALKGYTYIIGAEYYNNPLCNCNTGFIAEGFLRWGFLGIIIVFLFFTFFLIVLDGFQKKTNYIFAVGFGVFAIIQLADGQLISQLLCGYLSVWILFAILF